MKFQNKNIIIAILIIIALAVGWYLISPLFITIEVNEEIPTQALSESNTIESMLETISQGDFIESAHTVEGRALLISQNEEKILRFENFDTVNGPDLHIYLSSSLSNDDFIDLGKIKATKGNINYQISSSIDTEKYDKVLVWCVPFGVLFSYADLE